MICHHDLDELIVIDLAVTVDVRLAEPLVDLLVSELLEAADTAPFSPARWRRPPGRARAYNGWHDSCQPLYVIGGV